jgi:hypothetical protein
MGIAKLAFVLFLLFPFQLTPQEGLNSAHIHIVVVDGLGRNLGTAQVSSFVADGTGKNYAVTFQNDEATVPFDDYVLTVYSQGFFSAQKRVQVFQREVWVIVGLTPGAESRGSEPLTTVTGKAINVPSSERPIYVRLCGIYLDFVLDTALAADNGQFSITGRIPTGKFVLTISGRSGILYSNEVDIPTTKPLLLDLTDYRRGAR